MDAVEITIWAMALFMPLLGGFIVRRFLVNLDRCQRSLDWPVATGVVGGSAPGEAAPGQATGGRVEYRYEVDGKHYTSNRVFIGDSSILARPGSRTGGDAGQHAPVRRVEVYYDPDRPRLCVLEPGVHSEIYTDLILGVIVAGIGVALLLFLVSHTDLSALQPEWW